MFDRVIEFLERLAAGKGSEQAFSDKEKNTAVAALLYRMVSIDGIVRDVERMHLHNILLERFGISPGRLEKLVNDAKLEHADTAGLFPFTSIIMRRCEFEERRDIVVAMWRLALCDGELHEFEENLIARAAELLDVPNERPDA